MHRGWELSLGARHSPIWPLAHHEVMHGQSNQHRGLRALRSKNSQGPTRAKSAYCRARSATPQEGSKSRTATVGLVETPSAFGRISSNSCVLRSYWEHHLVAQRPRL